MFKQELYNGGVAGAVPMGVVPMPRDLVSGPLAEGMGRVAANVGQMMLTGVEMEDAKNEFESKRALMSLESETRADVERRLHLPDGHAEALFDKQGNLREVEVANLRARVEKRLAGVGANILDPTRRQEVQAAAGLTGMRLLGGMAESWQRVQRQKLETSWQDAFDLCVAEGRMGEAAGMIDRGVGLGLFSENRGKVMKLRLRGVELRNKAAAARAREDVSVDVGGRGYRGASAALAVAAAKEGKLAVRGTNAEVQSDEGKVQGDGGSLTLDEGMMRAERMADADGAPLTLNEGMMQEADTPYAANLPMTLQGVVEPEYIGPSLGIEGMRTLGADGEMPVLSQPDGAAARSMTLDEAKLARVSVPGVDVRVAETGDVMQDELALSEEQRQWTLMPGAVVRDFCEGLDDSLWLFVEDGADGEIDIFCRAYAPAVVQRVAARGRVNGELTVEDASEVVVTIALDALHANGAASVDSVVKMFDGAGIFEVLGEGDAAVGKVRAGAMVNDIKERMGRGTNKLGMEVIERMVDDKVNGLAGSGTERWMGMPYLNPGINEGDEYETRDEQWHALKDVWWFYRKDYWMAVDPGKYSTGYDEEEFEENAQRFYNWFMANKYSPLRDEYVKAAREVCIARVEMRLKDSYAGGDRYGGADGYVRDVEIARAVLGEIDAKVVDMVYATGVDEERAKADAARSEALRIEAQKAYGVVRERKAARSGEDEKRAKAEAKKAAEDEKRAKAEAKKAEDAERRRLAVARRQPRRGVWRWDGEQALDGEGPMCRVPEAVWRVMVDELGYDGETVPYLVVGGKQVLVTGYHDGGDVLFNTPAAMLLQVRGKKEGIKVNGELGYSFDFKSAK